MIDPAVVVDERISKLAREIVSQPRGASRDLAAVMVRRFEMWLGMTWFLPVNSYGRSHHGPAQLSYFVVCCDSLRPLASAAS